MKIRGIEVSGYKYSNALSQFTVEHVDRMAKRYAHAIEKHPYFCDSIDHISDKNADTDLKMCRLLLTVEARSGEVEAVDIIKCELCEAVQAYAHGDIAHTVEECYDTIAALLRTIDVLEGRQKLGKPETNS